MDSTNAMKTVSGALRHRLPIVIGVVVLCLLVGLAAVFLVPRSYQAEALLLVDTRWAGAQDPDAALRASDTLSRLYIAQATGRPLLQRVASLNRVHSSVDSLAKRVTASTVKGTTLVVIRTTAPSAEEAAVIANAVAQAVVEQNRSDVTNRFESTRNYLQAELARLDAATKAVQAEKVPANNPAAAGDHAFRLTTLQNQYERFYGQLQDATLGQERGISTLSISALAAPPTQPASPDALRYSLAALAAGLVLGVLAALVVERFDDRLYTPESLAAATESPLVVAIPADPKHTGAAARAYALAHASLMARHPGTRLLMVAAASTRDRADGAASQFGAAVAHDGQRVVVVRADADQLGVPHVASQNGSSVTTIPLLSTPEGVLGLRAIAGGHGQYDFAVLSVGSPDRSPAALSLANTAKLAMVVATNRETRFADAQRTARALRQAGIEVAGSIMVAQGAASLHEGSTAKA
jgi:capsular polysaccharide biosynthesis protein